MALAKKFSLVRSVLAALFAPQGRGLMLDGKQVEIITVTKLTGDTTGSVALSGIQRPREIYILPINDNAGAALTAAAPVLATYTLTNDTTIALTGLGSWTSAVLLVTGRSFNYN